MHGRLVYDLIVRVDVMQGVRVVGVHTDALPLIYVHHLGEEGGEGRSGERCMIFLHLTCTITSAHVDFQVCLRNL